MSKARLAVDIGGTFTDLVLELPDRTLSAKLLTTPAALRAAEYLLVVAVGLAGGVPPAVIYLLLFVLALHHYDLIARMEKGAPAGSAGGLLGWDGRVVVLTVATVAGVATVGASLLVGIVAGEFLVTVGADRRRRGEAG